MTEPSLHVSIMYPPSPHHPVLSPYPTRRSSDLLASTDLGFILGPRLNAAGRLDDISLGIECLLTGDEQLAGDMARELDSLNRDRDRKSTRLNSSHVKISYAVFCLKKKT